MNSFDEDTIKALLAKYAGPEEDSDPKARKRRRIIRAAAGLFTRQGYRKTSMEEVARQAGVAKGTVYLYFKNKVDLLIAAIADEKRQYLHLFAAFMQPEVPARERLRRFLWLGFTAGQQLPMLSRLMGGDREIMLALEEMEPAQRAEVQGMGAEHLTLMIRDACGEDNLNEVALDERARVLMGLFYCSGAFFGEKVRSGLSLERFGQVLADLLVDGMFSNATGSGRSGAQGKE